MPCFLYTKGQRVRSTLKHNCLRVLFKQTYIERESKREQEKTRKKYLFRCRCRSWIITVLLSDRWLLHLKFLSRTTAVLYYARVHWIIYLHRRYLFKQLTITNMFSPKLSFIIGSSYILVKLITLICLSTETSGTSRFFIFAKLWWFF